MATTVFGLASVLTPFFLGTVVGAIAGGRVPVGNATGDAVTSWLNPLSILIGALFVATGAYLAAVFLVSDARRAGAPDLERYFSTRALVAAVVTGALAAAGLVGLHRDARYIFDGLTGDGLPLVILSLVCGIGVLVLLRLGARRGARPLAVGAVAAVIWGWGVAQWPYLLPEKLTIDDAAAPSATLTGLLIVFGVAVFVVLPAIGLLFTLVQRNLGRGDLAARVRRRMAGRRGGGPASLRCELSSTKPCKRAPRQSAVKPPAPRCCRRGGSSPRYSSVSAS